MGDDRVFRMTRRDGSVEYGHQKNLSARVAGRRNWRHGMFTRIEATNPGAPAGWTDVTSEFLGEPRQRSDFEIMCDPLGEPGD